MHDREIRRDSDGPPPCPVCGENATIATGIVPRSPYLPELEFQIVRCRNCGLLRTDPWPTPDQLHDVYESGDYYSTIEASGLAKPDLPLIERIRTYIRARVVHHHFARGGAGFVGAVFSAMFRRRFGWAPKGLQPGALLDVGCGDGTFLLEAQKAGWNVCGLETSETAVKNAKALGLSVLPGSLEDRLFDDSPVQSGAHVERARTRARRERRPARISAHLEAGRMGDHSGAQRRILRSTFDSGSLVWLGPPGPSHTLHFRNSALGGR